MHTQIGTLSMALASNESLRLTLALDANRSTRPGAPPAVLPLVRAYPDRVRAALFRSPALKPPLSWVVPRRFDEGWGTWHAKLYGADDAVLISGANLSKDYFTARQDRYVHFRAPALASFCAGFLDEAAGWSYRLGPDGALVWPADAPPEGRFERHAGSGLRGYMKRARQVHSPAATDGADVRVYPVPQLGQFGIGDEAMAMSALLHADGAADLTSGYFGLAPGYAALVRGDVRVLCAAPRANGFFGARGVAGRVPEAYTLLEQRFARGAAPGVCMHEWAREGWTYHAKGVWARPARGVPPVATLLGSTNLSARSAALDAEMSVVMLSTHERVRAALGQEVDGLWEHAAPWRGNERRVRLGTRALVGLVGEML
jgi:CDP-diacylglycerol--glycerol-3-phosphate 3-phosphatidyltransferase